MFRAKNMSRDAMFCHQHAKEFSDKLNSDNEVVTTAQSLVAAATVAPEATLTEVLPGSGAVATVASCITLLCVILATLALF